MKEFGSYNSVERCHLFSAVSRYGVDKKDFVHFVNSGRWHCTIFTKTTRFNGDIDRAVRGVCDIRPEWTNMQFQIGSR